MLRLANKSYSSEIKTQRTQLRRQRMAESFSPASIWRVGGLQLIAPQRNVNQVTVRYHLKLISTVNFRGRQRLRERDL